jgi:phospholipase A1/A2
MLKKTVSVLFLLLSFTFADDSYNRYDAKSIALFSYKPMYFGYTTDHNEANRTGEAKLQFSFKYALIEESSFYLGYTQKAFWSIDSISAPFKETNYAPELFYTFSFNSWFEYLQLGFWKHESTGESGIKSVSWNVSYIEPAISFDNWLISLTLWGPSMGLTEFEVTSGKPYLFDYYGYSELNIAYTPTEGHQHSIMYRPGDRDHIYAVQYQWDIDFDTSRDDSWTPSFFVQVWSGYGESLQTYNKITNRVTVGLSIVK